MNRWLWMASIAMVMASTTGCLHHNTRGGAQPGQCNSCNSCGATQGGLLGRLTGCGRKGCTPGPIGWQQGGLNYSSHLCPHGGTAGHPGPHAAARGGIGHGGMGHGGMGHGGMGGAMMPGQQLQNQPFAPGPPTGAVAYPYYTHRGPRDFLLDNPPTIGR